jgi:hypothetical protein
MEKEISPEERLLALIKGKSKSNGAGRPPDSAQRARAEEVGGEKKSRIRAYLSEFFKSDIFKNRIFDPRRLVIVNRYLVIITAILFFYLLVEVTFIRPYRDLSLLISGISQASSAKAPKIEGAAVQAPKDYSYYSGDLSKKRVFGTAEEAADNTKAGISGGVSNDLGLVGIIPGDSPQAIIEDKKSQKTYYLTKGQSFDAFTLEEIGEGKVVLDMNGKKIVLFL